MLLLLLLMDAGGDASLHGARGAGGRHQLQPRRLFAHRHVRLRPGALGAAVALPRSGINTIDHSISNLKKKRISFRFFLLLLVF